MPETAIDKLLDATPRLWKGRCPDHRQHTVSTGHGRLDARLPGGGWPLGAVTELLGPQPGQGELSLLLPALAATAERGQWVIMIDPPWVPYPAALHGRGLPLERLLLVRGGGAEESLWACEQALRSGRGGAVLAWPREITFPRLRRLQLAASAQAKLAFLFRPETTLNEASPAALRLQLEPGAHPGVRVRIVKCRGAHPPPPVHLEALWAGPGHPFSNYGNDRSQTSAHEPCSRPSPRALLAGHTPATPRAGPAHPRAERARDAGGGERDHGSSRTDH